MKLILPFLRDAIVYGSVATVLALLLFGSFTWVTYGVDQEKTFRVLTAVYNVDVAKMEAKEMVAAKRGEHEDVAYEEVVHQRAMISLDNDLRQQSISKGLADLRLLQRDLIEERRRYDLLKKSFDAELERLQSVATDNSIVEVQLTLESIKPKQAKDHLVRMLPSSFGKGEFTQLPDDERKAVIDVVAILKAMPLDKRKKILAEFKTEVDAELLAELLRLIRLGVPDVKLVDETREKLQEFNAN